MARRYTSGFANVSVGAGQDLVSLLGASGLKLARVLRAWCMVTATSSVTTVQLTVSMRYLTPTATAGSGGSAGVVGKVDQGDAAASCTVRINDTTPATTGGTTVNLENRAFNAQGGIDVVFYDPPVIANGGLFAFNLAIAPLTAITMSGGIEWEEIGG